MTSAPAGSARARVHSAFDAIRRLGRSEIWVTLVEQERAHEWAAGVDAKVRSGADLPLAGMAFAVKDNIDVEGLPTTAAHPDYARRPAQSASAVQRLVDAGAVVIGKTNMDQFATGLVGTRSPYGVVRSAADPARVAGGSSSGSAAAVGHGLVDFALGTDTAGSGRVPAAFNGIVGVKPTRGLVPLDGVVPAARSYDTVSVLAPDVTLASLVLSIVSGPSALDPRSRRWPPDTRLAAPEHPRIAVADERGRSTLSPLMRSLYARAIEGVIEAGATAEEIDLAPFLEAAALLYGGALVAERREAFGDFMIGHPVGADPCVRAVVDAASTVTAAELVADQHRLISLGRAAASRMSGFDALVLPTAPAHPAIEAVLADPVGVNALLGTFTNFVNLLDMAAVAVPAGHGDEGLFGVSVIVRAFEDQVALDLVARMTGREAHLLPDEVTSLVVLGAHMSGQPLNGQLTEVGARLVGPAQTSGRYRLFALPGQPPRPGLVPVEAGRGVQVEGEEWLLSPAGLGRFASLVAEPLSLGPILLSDDRWVLGFLSTRADGEDISSARGWRRYLDSTRAAV